MLKKRHYGPTNNKPNKIMKIRFKVVLACSVMFFSELKAQKIVGLKIGDNCPDIQLEEIINYSKNKANISDFKGKALILDFWATWCSGCVSAFPKLDTLENLFKDKLQILPVTDQDEVTSANLLKRLAKIRNITLPPSVVNDTVLFKYFRHKLLPHYVWIDANSVVKAITGIDDINIPNLQKLINKESLAFIPIKNDDLMVQYDGNKPIFQSRQASASGDVSYHSMITPFRQDFSYGSFRGHNWISLLNHSIVKLYQLAFGQFDLAYLNFNRVIVLGLKNKMDSAIVGMVPTKELRTLAHSMRADNYYSYELFLPDSIFSKQQMFEIMQQDLNRFFISKGIMGKMEKRTTKIMALERTSTEDKIATKGGKQQEKYTLYSMNLVNLPFSRVISKFEASFYNDGAYAIQDRTGYKGNVDFEIVCDLRDINSVNSQLQKYDLKFVEKTEDIDMIVITKIDNVKTNFKY